MQNEKSKCISHCCIFFILKRYTHRDLRFGIKAGVNFSKFGSHVELDGRTSFHIGGLVDIPLNEQYHIQPELLFFGEGSEDANANLIRAAGVAKFFVLESFSLEGSPQFGLRVSEDDQVDRLTKGFDFGLVLGSAYELQDIGIFFSASYNFGLANLADNETFNTNVGTFQLSIVIWFTEVKI